MDYVIVASTQKKENEWIGFLLGIIVNVLEEYFQRSSVAKKIKIFLI
jgi:hypothetical protein